jgi:hypothetical protein
MWTNSLKIVERLTHALQSYVWILQTAGRLLNDDAKAHIIGRGLSVTVAVRR